MTKRTLGKILAFGMTIIIVTALLIVSVFYSYYEKQSQDKVNTVLSLVKSELEHNTDYEFINTNIDSQTRVTLIDTDGTVLADSSQNAALLENHMEREEVQNALKSGSAVSIRQSSTLKEKTFYKAILLDDGKILRVSTQAQGIASLLSDVSLYIVLVIIFVVAVSAFVSLQITKSIVKPVVQLGKNLNDVENMKTYKELTPFVDALKEQKEKQQALDKQKKQFTANLSHELKTPLTSIAGYAELIETGIAKPDDIKPFASTIRKQALRLVNVSEDIIKLSQLEESDDGGIVFSSIDLYAIAEKCEAALKINAQLKNIKMTLTGEEAYVKGNASLVEELIYNLCDNAIRYNKENGCVDITVVPNDTGGIVTVKDTGIGIDQKYQTRVFERFFRVDKSRSKETGGTGLGLAIVKHIAQIHNATLNVDSILGQGTKISVQFTK